MIVLFHLFLPSTSDMTKPILIRDKQLQWIKLSGPFLCNPQSGSDGGSRGSRVTENRPSLQRIDCNGREVVDLLKAPKHGARVRKRDAVLLSSQLAHV